MQCLIEKMGGFLRRKHLSKVLRCVFKARVTLYYTVLLPNKHLLPQEARSPRSGCQDGQVPVKMLSLVEHFSLWPRVAERTQALCGVSFIRALIPSMTAPEGRVS